MPSLIRIYDNGGKSVDRYTLVVPSVNEPGKLDMYGFNEDPYSPSGFGQYAGSYNKMGSYSHLGKLVGLGDLSEQAQRYVRKTLTPPLPDGYGLAIPEYLRGKKVKKTAGRKSKSARRRSSPRMTLGGMR